jgi:hypothetical protein
MTRPNYSAAMYVAGVKNANIRQTIHELRGI